MDSLKFHFVGTQRHGDIVVLLINDPPANTLTYDMVVQLEDIFFELALDGQTRAIVLSGAGERFFSGGVNIGMPPLYEQKSHHCLPVTKSPVWTWIEYSSGITPSMIV